MKRNRKSYHIFAAQIQLFIWKIARESAKSVLGAARYKVRTEDSEASMFTNTGREEDPAGSAPQESACIPATQAAR